MIAESALKTDQVVLPEDLLSDRSRFVLGNKMIVMDTSVSVFVTFLGVKGSKMSSHEPLSKLTETLNKYASVFNILGVATDPFKIDLFTADASELEPQSIYCVYIVLPKEAAEFFNVLIKHNKELAP